MKEIEDFIDKNIRPALQSDGGDLEFVSFDINTGIVGVRYVGACAHCPNSSLGTHMAIESALTKNFTHVTGIERIP